MNGAVPQESRSGTPGSAPPLRLRLARPRRRSRPCSERCSPPAPVRCATTRRCWRCACSQTTCTSRRCPAPTVDALLAGVGRREPLDERERALGHLAPAVVDRERVAAVGDLLDL